MTSYNSNLCTVLIILPLAAYVRTGSVLPNYLEEVDIVHAGREEEVVESKQPRIHCGFHTNKVIGYILA